MSTTYQITSAQITDFIAFVLSNLECNLASDLERLHGKLNPRFSDYDCCYDNIRHSLDRACNQLQGVSLLFSSYNEINKQILVAMDAAQQSYELRFEEVQALKFPKKQSSADQSSPSSLDLPVETLENSALDTVDSSASALKAQPQKLPAVTLAMIAGLRFFKQNLDHVSCSNRLVKPRPGTLSALISRGLVIKNSDNILIPTDTGLSIIDIDDNAIGVSQ